MASLDVGVAGPLKPAIFVLEIGRPIKQDVASLFGVTESEIHTISVMRAITETEIPEIAAKAYKKVMELARGGRPVYIVLSGPLALSFQLGQALGLSHANIVVYQFMGGKYVQVPPLTRTHLFEEVK